MSNIMTSVVMLMVKPNMFMNRKVRLPRGQGAPGTAAHQPRR